MKFSLGLLVLLILAACGTGPSPPDNPSVNLTSSPLGFHLLVAVTGEVKLKPNGWSDYHTTGFGSVLVPGDLLWPEEGAMVRVLCEDLNISTVTAGVPSGVNVICPFIEDPITRNDIPIINTRDGNNQAVPYIIRPRATKLLNPTPRLKWNDTGASSYTVQIFGVDFAWEQAGITQTELLYPGEPVLQPGVPYTLVVEDNNHQRSNSHPQLAFEILDDSKQQNIEATVKAINRVDDISTEAQNLAVIQFYQQHGLIAEAMELLQTLIDQGNQQPIVYRLLGDSYLQVGLAQFAEQPYLKALQLAEQQHNTGETLAVQAGLGLVYVNLGKAEPALDYLEKAKTGYTTLGADSQTAQIETYLSRLQ